MYKVKNLPPTVSPSPRSHRSPVTLEETAAIISYVPLALITSFIFKNGGKKISIPWFILWFIVAILVNTYLLDNIPELGKAISGLARKGLIVTMFFIGASLSTDVLKSVGMKPLVQGVLLWIVISVSSLIYILWA